MKLDDPSGYPVVILGHRKDQFIESAIESMVKNLRGASELVIVDDSGNPEHHQWLDNHGYQYSLSDSRGRNIGYRGAMNTVFETAGNLARTSGRQFALLWEEDFWLTREVNLHALAEIMLDPANSDLAQLNLQRQPVYRVERQHGYLESHRRRGYGLTPTVTNGEPWIRRLRPFTTNPGLIRAEILDMSWPSSIDCARTPGGAEPAMSAKLESEGYRFGWYGKWNTKYTHHVGTEMKTGHGY